MDDIAIRQEMQLTRPSIDANVDNHALLSIKTFRGNPP